MNKPIYKVLQEIMDERDLSIPDIARFSDLSDSTIRAIIVRKSKTVALEVAFKLSTGLDVTLERLNGMGEELQMGFGKRIKEARESKGLTQSELGELVGVTGSAITNYEKETSHPKKPILYKLIEALGVDANYLFQDSVLTAKKEEHLTPLEQNHIRKYRTLDDRGKENVDTILEKEYQYILKQQEPQPESKDEYIPDTIAAHNDGEITEAHNRDFSFGLEKAKEKRQRSERNS